VPVEVAVQRLVDKYAAALQGPRLLFDLWPRPRTPGRPEKKYTALASAVVLGVTGAFESFAEDLLAAALIQRGHGWAHVAANADLSNPSLETLRDRLSHTTGFEVKPPNDWALTLPTQSKSNPSKWTEREVSWGTVLKRSESWIEVRHCLAHGAVTGIGPERWPGPVSKAHHSKQARLPSANDEGVLARVGSDPEKRGLYLWPSVSCARIFSAGAVVIACAVAEHLGEALNTSAVPSFGDV